MKKGCFWALILIMLLGCELEQTDRIEVISISKVEKTRDFDIMTEYGGYQFDADNVKIAFDDSINTPKGVFLLERGYRTKLNTWQPCTLIFKNVEQAKEWLSDTNKIAIKGNVNSTISASYSESHNRTGCFISTL